MCLSNRLYFGEAETKERTLVNLAEDYDAGEACARVVGDGGVVEEDAFNASVASWRCFSCGA